MDKTRLRLLFVLVGLVCALPAFSQEKNTTFWIGGPLMVEFRPDQTSTFTIGAGFAPVTVEEEDFFGTTQVIEFGFAIEAFYFQRPSLDGLGLSFRVGSGGGASYFGPGVFYVNRPEKKVCFRAGAHFPIGDNIVPFTPEIAIGFRF